jgi:hypothetical protein
VLRPRIVSMRIRICAVSIIWTRKPTCSGPGALSRVRSHRKFGPVWVVPYPTSDEAQLELAHQRRKNERKGNG